MFQLQKFVTAMSKYHTDCHEVMASAVVFPIEVDLTRGTFTYDTTGQINDGQDDDEGEEVIGGTEGASTNNSDLLGDLINTN